MLPNMKIVFSLTVVLGDITCTISCFYFHFDMQPLVFFVQKSGSMG